MSYIPVENIIKDIGSLYKAVNLAAKRAIEMKEGAPKLVSIDSSKLSTIALEEIMQKKVNYKKIPTEKKKADA